VYACAFDRVVELIGVDVRVRVLNHSVLLCVQTAANLFAHSAITHRGAHYSNEEIVLTGRICRLYRESLLKLRYGTEGVVLDVDNTGHPVRLEESKRWREHMFGNDRLVSKVVKIVSTLLDNEETKGALRDVVQCMEPTLLVLPCG
jgi:hypothetical protein